MTTYKDRQSRNNPFTHVESKLSRVVVHPTGVHETQRVSYGFCAQNSLSCDWTDTSVSQCGGHYAAGFTRDLYGA